MGSQDVASGPNDQQMRAFTRAVLDDLHGLERMIEEDRFETGVRRIGAEQEMFLVDRSRLPAPIAVEVLERVSDDRLTTELAKYNLEANLTPQVFGSDCLRKMEDEVKDLLERVDAAAREQEAAVALTGILPTLRKSHLTLDFMTPNPRYFELNRAISALKDGAFDIVIKGLDELEFSHDNVMLEAANTSFQIHFQVGPNEFAMLYNLAQAVSAPVLAAAVNSPLLLGQRLWNETRVALFQRSVDARSATHKMRAKPPRVSFGDKWLEEGILEIYRDDITRFRIMLSTEDVEKSALDILVEGGLPELRALRMHTGTVWRWNRACYGIGGGKPHLRIENRVLPAGPTVVDEIANAAFFFGLMAATSEEYPNIQEVMEFDDAKQNFFAAARHGLDAQFVWIGGKRFTAQDLIIEELLPKARQGLSEQGIDGADVDRYLGVIEERVRSQQTGSQWMLGSLAKMQGCPKDVRMRSLVSAIAKNQRKGDPVHTWPPAELYRTQDWFPSYRTVGQFMSTDLFTVRPTDPVGLAARTMEWRQIRHLPVEDDHGKLIGLLSFRDLLKLIAKPGKAVEGVVVEEIMRKDPLTVSEATATLDALSMMRTNNIGSLPVIDDEGRLVGLITVYDLLDIAGRVLEDFLRAEDSRPSGPFTVTGSYAAPDPGAFAAELAEAERAAVEATDEDG
ncbi:MAG TPA: CBS domain-containing protein [Polyangiaceae bacterium]|nr:CBS domain-containing protein [Polyangiaceae bacterium]